MEIHATSGSVSISMATWYNAAGGVDIFRREAIRRGPAGWQRDATPPDGNPDEHLIGAGPRHFADVIRGAEQPILTAGTPPTSWRSCSRRGSRSPPGAR